MLLSRKTGLAEKNSMGSMIVHTVRKWESLSPAQIGQKQKIIQGLQLT